MNGHQIRYEDIPQIFQKHFPQHKKQSIKLTRLLGMTNIIYKISTQNKSYVFIIFVGAKNPALDNKIYKKLSENSIAPQCYYQCQQYRITEFIQNAIHPDVKEFLTNKKFISKFLDQVYRFHQVKIQQISQNQLFADTILTQSILKKIYDLKTQKKDIIQNFITFKKKLINLFQKKQKIKERLKISNKQSISLCHNDLHNLNIFLLNPNTENQKVKIIDYDYIGYNYLAYDLANHLNQMCIHYIQKYPGFQVHHHINDQQISMICSLYKGNYKGLDVDIKKMLVLCNIYWAQWSLQKSIDAVLQTFDNLIHGEARLQLAQYYYKQLFCDQLL